MKRIAIATLAAILVAGAQTKDEPGRLLKAERNVGPRRSGFSKTSSPQQLRADKAIQDVVALLAA